MSIVAMKRKANNNNPRLGPASGRGKNNFFSINGTRRNVGGVGPTNLAPRAQTGPSQLIPSSSSLPTGPGINGRPSSVCTNDPTVVKSSVINTKGMLSRRLNGLSRNPPSAPDRLNNQCSYGPIITPATQLDDCPDRTCNPIWVKQPIIPNGNQQEYIETFVSMRGGISYQGGCNVPGLACIEAGIANGLSIKDAKYLCSLGTACNKITTDWDYIEGPIRRALGSGKSKLRACNTTKDLVNSHCNGNSLRVLSQGEYTSRNLKFNQCLPQTDLNNPIPRPFSNQDSQCQSANLFNVNTPPCNQLSNAINLISSHIKTNLPNYSICLVGNSETIESDLQLLENNVFIKYSSYVNNFNDKNLKLAVNLINSLNIILKVKNKPMLYEVGAVPNSIIPLLKNNNFGLPVFICNGINILAFSKTTLI